MSSHIPPPAPLAAAVALPVSNSRTSPVAAFGANEIRMDGDADADADDVAPLLPPRPAASSSSSSAPTTLTTRHAAVCCCSSSWLSVHGSARAPPPLVPSPAPGAIVAGETVHDDNDDDDAAIRGDMRTALLPWLPLSSLSAVSTPTTPTTTSAVPCSFPPIKHSFSFTAASSWWCLFRCLGDPPAPAPPEPGKAPKPGGEKRYRWIGEDIVRLESG